MDDIGSPTLLWCSWLVPYCRETDLSTESNWLQSVSKWSVDKLDDSYFQTFVNLSKNVYSQSKLGHDCLETGCFNLWINSGHNGQIVAATTSSWLLNAKISMQSPVNHQASPSFYSREGCYPIFTPAWLSLKSAQDCRFRDNISISIAVVNT